MPLHTLGILDDVHLVNKETQHTVRWAFVVYRSEWNFRRVFTNIDGVYQRHVAGDGYASLVETYGKLRYLMEDVDDHAAIGDEIRIYGSPP